MHNGEFKKSLECIAVAYNQLIEDYEKSKEIMSNRSIFNIGREIRRSGKVIPSDERNIELVKVLRQFQQDLKPLLFKFDYRKYLKFKYITPDIFTLGGKPIWFQEGKRTFTSEGA